MAPDAATIDLAIRPPASAIFCNGEESLRLSALNALAGVRLRVAGRFMHMDGRIEPIVDTLLPASDRSVSVKTLPLAVGWLCNAQVSVSAGTPQTGQTFAVLSLVRGRTGAFEELATLAAGPITAVHRLAWPGSLILSSVEGAGALRTISGTTPGAGVEVSESVPTGARWQLLQFACTLTTSAVAGNRDPFVIIDDGTNVLQQFGQGLTTAAGVTRRQYWSTGLSLNGTGFAGSAIQGLPTTLLLLPGHRILTGTTALDVGDQYSLVRYTVREWIEGA
jgi:hypothetical protein